MNTSLEGTCVYVALMLKFLIKISTKQTTTTTKKRVCFFNVFYIRYSN